MADKQPVLLTFHKIREQGEQGSPDAWRAFLDLYSPLYLHVLNLYVPPETGTLDAAWKKTLGALSANNFERFRATPRQSERECLVDMRAVLLENLLEALRPDASDLPAGSPTSSEETADSSPDSASTEANFNLESLGKLVAELPLLHQEMLFFRLSGYTDASIELMLRVAPKVAQAAFDRLPARYSPGASPNADANTRGNRCLGPVEWLLVQRAARAAKTDKCPEWHQFLRIHDGQVSWYDKEPVEKHVTNCLHCLDAWAALREVNYWRRTAPAVLAARLDEFMTALPLALELKKSLLQRVFR